MGEKCLRQSGTAVGRTVGEEKAVCATSVPTEGITSLLPDALGTSTYVWRVGEYHLSLCPSWLQRLGLEEVALQILVSDAVLTTPLWNNRMEHPMRWLQVSGYGR